MKNRLLYILLGVLLVNIISLEAQNKKVLVEHFTNTRCPICKNNNPGFYVRMDKYKDDVIHIAYHPSVPYESCEFYQQNIPGNSARQQHYNIVGTPTAFLDGKKGASSLPSNADYEAAISVAPLVDILFTRSDKKEVEVVVKALVDIPSDLEFTIFTALTERKVNYAAPNGETEHFDVFRMFINHENNGVKGVFSSGTKAGEEIVFHLGSIVYNSDNWNASDFDLVSFVALNDKQVLQAAKTVVQEQSNTHIPAKLSSLQVFPNPANQIVTLKWSEVNAVAGMIEIIGADGKSYITENTMLGVNTQILDVNMLPSGHYIVIHKLPNGIILDQQKLIIK